MRLYLRSCLLLTLVVALGAGPALGAGSVGPGGSAGRLFDLEAGDLPAFRGVEAAWRVRIDTDLLAQGPSRLEIETPDGLQFDARRLGFERRGSGSLTWRGRTTDSAESRVILSMEDGALSGWIHTPFGQYEIRPLADGGSAVLRMSNEPLGGCGADHVPAVERQSNGAAAPRRTARAPVAGDSASSIDVLGLFTAEARDAMGGVAQVKSRVRLMIDLANEAFGNSRMTARMRLVHLGLSPLAEQETLRDNLSPLRQSQQVKNLRDVHSADLVALVQSNDTDLCGVAYIMDELSPAFAPWAYSVTAYACVTTFAHEVGHNMGMEHDPANGNSPQVALFPWAFAHFVSGDWRTVMAYPDPCGGCTRVPYFSNPGVMYEGKPMGIPNERDNARTGDRTAGVIADFRLSGVVLADDFEGGAPSGWQRNRGNLTVLQPGLAGDHLLNVRLAGLSSRRFLMHRIGGNGKGVDVEFLFNANGAELEGAEVDILVLFGRGKAHTKLVLEEDGDRYRVSLITKGADGAYLEVASTPVRATTTEKLRIEWRGASDPEVADGFLSIAKNDRSRGALRDFANDRFIVKEVRVGLTYGDVGTAGRGSLYFDNYIATVPVP